MNAHLDANRLILDWLAADRGRVDEAGVSAAIASTRGVPQHRGLLGLINAPRPWPGATGWRLVQRPASVLAVILALAAIATGAVLVGNQLHLSTPVSPTPTASSPATLPNGPTREPVPSPSRQLPTLVGNGSIILTAEVPIPGDPGGATTTSILAIGLDGTTRESSLPACPFFSPDGRSIAYLRADDSTTAKQQLVIANADNTQSQVVWGGLLNSQTPHAIFWSPNSARVALTQAQDIAGALVVIDLASMSATNLTSGSHEFPGESAFSPDGTRLATIGGAPGGLTGISVAEIGSSRGQLVASAPFIRTLAWSPDGTTIAYVAANGADRRGGGDGDLYVVSPAGTGQRLVDGGDESYYAVAWSPDGKYLAVTNDTGPTVVFDRTGTEVFRFDNTGDYVTWAPDSTALLARVGRAGASIVDIATGVVRTISYPDQIHAPSFVCPLAWQPVPVAGR